MAEIFSFSYRQNGQDQFATTGQHATKIVDCRDLWNPHADAKLRALTGQHVEVQNALWRSEKVRQLVREAVAYLRANPEGRIAFGCSWGKHRSVALAEMTADFIGPRPTVRHTSKSMEALRQNSPKREAK